MCFCVSYSFRRFQTDHYSVVSSLAGSPMELLVDPEVVSIADSTTETPLVAEDKVLLRTTKLLQYYSVLQTAIPHYKVLLQYYNEL